MIVSSIGRMANKWGIICLLVLYAVVFGTILIFLAQLREMTGGIGILDFEVGYTPERVDMFLGSYGEAGMQIYRRIQVLDLLNPALYSLLAATLTYLLWKGRGPIWLCLLPLLGGLADYAENVTLFLLVQSYPNQSDGLVRLSSALSLVKNGLLAAGMLPLLAGAVMWIWRKLR